MEFRVLGPLEVRADDKPLPLGGAKQRALLALLVLNAGRVVPRERIVDALWGDEPPESAVKGIQLYVWQLRKLLPDGAIVTLPAGYVLEADDVDLVRFERLVAEARGAAPAAAVALLRDALALWHGPPLAGLVDGLVFRAEAGRLEELRLAAVEDRIDADLALGGHARLVAELETLIAEHPHRERLRGQLMLALYRSGRQAESLEAYRAVRAALDEVGLEPGPALRELEKRILTQEATLELVEERALLPDPPPLPGPLVPEPPFPFVGREAELAMLRAALERAEGGVGGLVLVAAEAGGGKTRLIREFTHEAASRGVVVCYGASDSDVTTPYEPLRAWLEFLLRVADHEALRSCLGARGRDLTRLFPELERLTGSPPAGEIDRYSLQAAVTELLTGLARLQPLLLVLDDVHWADGETMHLLRRLARTAPEQSLLVVAAYRGEETGGGLDATLADLARLDGAVRLDLQSLDDDDVAAFVLASAEAEATSELVAAMGKLTSGTPLLVCELWRELQESGAIEVTAAVRLTRRVADLRGSSRLAEVVQQRLARLDAGTRVFVEIASVAGASFELAVVGDAADLDARAVLAPVEEAVRIGILEELPGSVASCRFGHELVRRAVYDSITLMRRAELHLHVGEALERVHALDVNRVLPELAHHFTQAAPIAGRERAIDYNRRASEAAQDAAAWAEAESGLSAALALGVDDLRERVHVQIELAHLLRNTGHWRQADALVESSIEIATALGDRDLRAHVLLARGWMGIWNPAVDTRELQAIAEEAIDALAVSGEERSLAEAWRLLGVTLRYQGHAADACAAYERAIAMGEGFGARCIGSLAYALYSGPLPITEASGRCAELIASYPGQKNTGAVVTRCLSALLAMAGRFEEARELDERAARVLDASDHAASWIFRDVGAAARVLWGDRAGAERELETMWLRGQEFARGDAFDWRALKAAYELALFYCDEGRWDEAERCVEYGGELPASAAFTAEVVLRLAARARIAAQRGELAEAVALAQRGVAFADRSDLLDIRARVRLALAEVHWLASDKERADQAVASACALYKQKGNVAAIGGLGAVGATQVLAAKRRPSR